MTSTETQSDNPKLRADARHSITLILDAAIHCLSDNAKARMTSVANAAGVGRTTLYAHFPTREALVEATVVHAIKQGDTLLDGLELDQVPPSEAVTALIEKSWQVIASYGRLISAVERSLGSAALRQHHRSPLQRVATLIARGQEAGDFRIDLPTEWLVAVFYSLMHTAVREVDSGRLDADLAPRLASTTYLNVLRGDAGTNSNAGARL